MTFPVAPVKNLRAWRAGYEKIYAMRLGHSDHMQATYRRQDTVSRNTTLLSHRKADEIWLQR